MVLEQLMSLFFYIHACVHTCIKRCTGMEFDTESKLELPYLTETKAKELACICCL